MCQNGKSNFRELFVTQETRQASSLLDSYAKLLENETLQMKQRHSLPHPVREVIT